MNPKTLLPILGLFLLITGDIDVIAKETTPVVASPSSESVTSPASDTVYRVIDNAIQNPKILRMNWAGMSKAFPAQCKKNGDAPELSCPPVEGILEFSVLTSGAGLIDMVLTRPATCEEIYALVAKRYGPGTIANGDKCSADWNLSHLVKGAYIRLSKSRKHADKFFLQLAIEQGP